MLTLVSLLYCIHWQYALPHTLSSCTPSGPREWRYARTVLTALLALDVMFCLAHDGDDDGVCLMCWLCDPALHAVAHLETCYIMQTIGQGQGR